MDLLVYLVYKTQVTRALCGSLKPLKLMCQAGLTWEKKIWILTTQISEICFLSCSVTVKSMRHFAPHDLSLTDSTYRIYSYLIRCALSCFILVTSSEFLHFMKASRLSPAGGVTEIRSAFVHISNPTRAIKVLRGL